MKTCNKIAFYPGTFDPFTIGHQSLVNRALRIFDKIIIAVGINEAKKCLYTTKQRVDMITNLYADNPHIKVIDYDGLTVTAAQNARATAILRGIRSTIDFEYEKSIADINRDIAGIETVLLYTEPAYAHISSSIIRELIRLNQPITQFIPKGMQLPHL